jgi:intracellular multiplication protein IcmD
MKTMKYVLASVVTWSLGGLLMLAQAGGDQTLGDLAEAATGSVSQIVDLVVALCYVSGIGFASAGVLKFKQHKDNPAQVTLGTCFMLLFIGIGLVWLPTLIEATGVTIFGTGAETGTSAGGDIFGTNTGGSGG